jgi:3-hydroxymyristoyl/3-hydroxydecanoyl-(acyl carrier protein) dehydratase
MVNPAIEGKVYPPTEPYEVGREKIAEFARATMATGSSEFAAPTFPVVIQERSMATVLGDPEAEIDFSRVVHGDQRFSFVRPIRAGDVLHSELEVTSVKSLAGNQLVTFETRIFDSTKQLVCAATSTLVVRGASE